MSDFGRVYLDANIFIYVVERRVAVADLLTTLLLGENARALQPLVTSDLTLAETLVHPLRFQNEELIGIYSNWALTNHRLEVGIVSMSHQARDLDLMHRKNHRGRCTST